MTHLTKYGFGGLLKADLPCDIISQDGEKLCYSTGIRAYYSRQNF